MFARAQDGWGKWREVGSVRHGASGFILFGLGGIMGSFGNFVNLQSLAMGERFGRWNVPPDNIVAREGKVL